MDIRQTVNRHWAIASAIGIAAFIVLITVALLTVVPTSDSGRGARTNSSALANDRLETMLTNGDLHEMLQQHQQMMETMRTDTSPSMITRMDNDPMWQMLKSGELIKLMEEHQQAIDEMLAK